MKRVLAFVISPLVLLVRHVLHEVHGEQDFNVVSELRVNAIRDSAKFVGENLDGCLLFDKREDLWEYSLKSATLPGAFVELGVYNGESIRYMAEKVPNVEFFGFDSFMGLAEDWSGTAMGKGHFALDGHLPKVPSNVKLMTGWFESTLPDFLNNHAGPLSFIHFDADTYESTNFALETFSPWILAGTVLVFDEFFGYPNWRNGEFRAWNEFVEARHLQFKFIAFSKQQAAIKVVG
jgi:hypothetical protein